jgi:hypothetical protein
MYGVNPDHDGIALTGLHKVQHQFCQVFAQHYVFGAHSKPKLLAGHVECELQFGEIVVV